jgi:hypothetical protein
VKIQLKRKKELAQALKPPPATLYTDGLYILDNALLCAHTGISLDQDCLHIGDTRLSGNRIYQCSAAGIVAKGHVFSGPKKTNGSQRILSAEQSQVKLDLISRIEILSNILCVSGDGIVVGTDDARIEGNDIGSSNIPGTAPVGSMDDGSSGNAIVLAQGLVAGISSCQVIGNRIFGVTGAGISIQTKLQSAMIKQNSIGAAFGGILMDDGTGVDMLSIENNHLLNIAPSLKGGEIELATAIRMLNVVEASVTGNSIKWESTQGLPAGWHIGILCVACSSLAISGNDITDASPVKVGARTTGIAIESSFGSANLVNNKVFLLRALDERSPDFISPSQSLMCVGIAISGGRDVLASREKNMLDPQMVQLLQQASAFAKELDSSVGLETGLCGNEVQVLGPGHVAEVANVKSCLFANNRCSIARGFSNNDNNGAAVLIDATKGIVANANCIQGFVRDVALKLGGTKQYTVLGNTVWGFIKVKADSLPDQDLGDPWKGLNVIMS